MKRRQVLLTQSAMAALVLSALCSCGGGGGGGSDDDSPPIVTTPIATVTPTPEATPDEEDDPLPTDPGQRACAIIQRTNISIPNVSTPIVQTADDDCPLVIDTLVAVGNIHRIPFEYEVVSDVPDIEIDPALATVAQGQLMRHDGRYLCTRSDSFTATITARIVRYFPADGPEITTAEAIALCGSSANVGNTEESKVVTVQVIPPAP